MGDYIVLIISCIFVNNILLAQFLGNCPFFGTSKKMETAVGMAMAVIFVLVLSGVITWLIYHLSAGSLGVGISSDHRLHSRDCLSRPIRGDVS
jgi:electron transport complex protein RnfA